MLGGPLERSGFPPPSGDADRRSVVYFCSAVLTGAGLWRVAAVGGEPERLTTPDPEQGEVGHAWPEILPGGDAVLFTVVANPIEESEIAVLSLATGERKVIIRGGYYPKYSPTGHLLYGVEGNLWAVGFDPSRLEAVGDPVPVQEGVLTKGLWGTMDFGVAENGSLLYVSGVATDPQTADRTLVWVDRQGREEPIAMPPRPYYSARLSPDGTRVAVEVRDSNTDIWVHDFARATQTRLTFDPGLDRFPVWTPNGERIAFSSQRDGGILDIFWKPADGTGQPELVVSDPDRRLDAWSWTPDGQSLLINEGGPDIGIVTLGGDQARQPVLDEDFREGTPEVSPDGRWMAYRSDESGRNEIYVRPFPDVAGGKWQVSAEGGNYPAWSRDGRELFYRTLAGTDPPLMGVTVETEPTFSASVPQTVIEAGYVFASRQGRNWDISADGQRFLMLKESGATDDASAQRAQIILVQNWFEELNRLVPTN